MYRLPGARREATVLRPALQGVGRRSRPGRALTESCRAGTNPRHSLTHPISGAALTAGRDTARSRTWCALAAALAVAGCDGDPTASGPVCGEAPAIGIDDPVTGVLTRQDTRSEGAYIDYYSLQLTDSTNVRITLASPDFDPFLYVFLPTQPPTVRAQAFDPVGQPPGEEETAGLSQRLDRGCHLLGASTWGRGETGSYDLLVEIADNDDEDLQGAADVIARSSAVLRTGRSSERYWIASARWSGSSASVPSRSAMVRATLRIR